MSYINRETRIIEKLTDTEAKFLTDWIEKYIAIGNTPGGPEPATVTAWKSAFPVAAKGNLVQTILYSLLLKQISDRKVICELLKSGNSTDEILGAIQSLIDVSRL